MKSPATADPYIVKFTNLLNTLRESDKNEQTQLSIIGLIHKYLPPWYIPMLNDKKRNMFYEKMIKRHVKGKTVLEIGAGVGFLSIMAAEHGAKHVYACELNPLMYYLAKENIENGPYSKKITLYFAHSDSLKLKTHIPKKVDIILSELISSDIFSENMAPTLKDAKKFLKIDGIFLHSEIVVYGLLIELKMDLPSKEKSSNSIVQLLKKLTANQSTYVDLNLFPFRALSKPIKLFSLEDGIDAFPELPIQFEIQKNQKNKTKNTYFCVYFSINDGRNKLLNLDIKKEKNNCHWENLVWGLDNSQSSYNLKLIKQEERLCLISAPKPT
jgi:SAM-dependent methyltransferase